MNKPIRCTTQQACSIAHAKMMQEKDEEIERFKKENEELKGDIKKLLNVREILRSKSVSIRAFAIMDRVFNPIKEKWFKGEVK